MQTIRRIALLSTLLLFLIGPLAASVSVRINDVGIKGWIGARNEPVRFTIENDGPPLAFNLRISTAPASAHQFQTPNLVYEEEMQVPSGTSQLVREVPLSFAQNVKVELLNDAGKVVASATSIGLAQTVVRGNLVVVYCHDPSTVFNVRAEVISSGNADLKTRKERDLDFVAVDNIEAQPWYYSTASAIVLADPPRLSTEQKKALEDYVRAGGALVVTPESASATGFNLAYFKLDGRTQMGRGRIYELSKFKGELLDEASNDFLSSPSGGQTVLDQIAWRIRLPKMRTMISLMIAYILLIGAVNFTVLRRLGRLELGWITVPTVAILFTLGAVAFSISRGFTGAQLDQASTYYMDSNSSTAYVYDGMRVTAPSRGSFILQLPSNSSFVLSYSPWQLSRDNVHIGDDVLGTQRGSGTLWTTRRIKNEGKRAGVTLDLMRWSFEESFGRRIEEEKGTVTVVKRDLRNSTGIRFKQAVVIKRDTNEFYDLGSLGPDASVQLGLPQRIPVAFPQRYERQESRELSLTQLAAISGLNKAFIGVAADDAPEESKARIVGVSSRLFHARIFVVGLE